MLAVGGIKIAAGLVVAVLPRIGGYLVAAWLATIVANLLIKADFYDIALRDFGLLLGALSLARLATAFRGVRASLTRTGEPGRRVCRSHRRLLRGTLHRSAPRIPTGSSG